MISDTLTDPRKLAIVILGFFFEFFVWGLNYSYLIFYAEYVTVFKSTWAFMSIVGVSAVSIGNFISPLAAWVITRTSYSFVMCCCGILLGLAFYVTSFDDFGIEVFFTYSTLFGAATGCFYCLFNYFIDNLGPEGTNIAISVATSASGFGLLLYCSVAAYYIEYGTTSWRVILRYFALSGFLVILIALGFGFLDRSSRKTRGNNHPDTSGTDGEHEMNLRSSSMSESDGQQLSAPGEVSPLIAGIKRPRGYVAHGWKSYFSSDLRPFKLSMVHCFMTGAHLFPINIGLYYASVVSSDAKDYYMIASIGLAVILSRSAVTIVQLINGYVIGGLVQTKVNQIGACITLLVMASYKTTDMSLKGALIGIGIYTFFVSSKSLLLVLIVLLA